MAVDKAWFTWRGAFGGPRGHSMRTRFEQVYSASVANTNSFAQTFNTFSKCRLYKAIWARQWGIDQTVPLLGNVDRKMVVFLSHPTDGVIKLSYPDPVDADVEETAQGLRMKASSLETLVGHINLWMGTGTAIKGLYGIVVLKR